MSDKDDTKTASTTCPNCGGSGTVPFGTELLPCGHCDGTGKVKSG